MQRIFVDSNILVAVLNKEYPLYTDAARVLSLSDHKQYEIFTSGLCLAIAWYFSAKKNGPKVALDKINLLVKHIKVCSIGNEEVINTLQNKSIHDFEDGLEYYSAIGAGCHIIATENKDDFYFSDLLILNSEELIRYVQERV